MECQINNSMLQLVQGDITEQSTDAIVNAANRHLQLGGGVAGAIRQKGGPAIQKECDTKSPIGIGEAVITNGGSLKAKFVIHTVGPRMGEGNEDEKLKNATINALKVADENNLTSISFPAVSTGIFGYPIDRCALIMLSESIKYLKGQTSLTKVVFCLYDKKSYDIFENTLKQLS